MNGNITFSMIKPDAVKKHYTGAIIKIFNDGGFIIKALKQIHLTKSQAEIFYGVHKDKPFYQGLINFITSGPIIAMILEKDNAVADFRKLIGATNPANAEAGTVRKLFATDVQQNAVHGSDSDENAIIESNFMFSSLERF